VKFLDPPGRESLAINLSATFVALPNSGNPKPQASNSKTQNPKAGPKVEAKTQGTQTYSRRSAKNAHHVLRFAFGDPGSRKMGKCSTEWRKRSGAYLPRQRHLLPQKWNIKKGD